MYGYSDIRLKPSNSVPKFFPEGNNIQQFLDWTNDGSLGGLDIGRAAGTYLNQSNQSINHSSSFVAIAYHRESYSY